MEAPKDPKLGADIEEIRRSIRALDALDKADGDFFELEDADYEFMAEKVGKAHFRFANNEIFQFLKDVCEQG